tara:strand:+ start:1901 stop:2974 length:1074 start_codon:yes stop_codon:yes gene_type:complete
MAIKNSGSSLSFTEIENEFGKNSERSLGSYRISDNGVANNGGDAAIFSNLPLDTGIPQSGPIKFSHFYGKRLNVFVDLYSPVQQLTNRINAHYRYINNTSKVKVVGEFKNRPSNTSGTRVFIHVNNDVASKKGNEKYVALRTGNGWQAGTILSVDVGSGGAIYGAGGDGGKGRVCNEDGGYSGKSGTSALGIEYNGTSVNLYSGGRIQCGFGGGGGGGGGVGDPDKSFDDSASSGGGGGGGAGLPVGEGGPAGTGAYGEGSDGAAGSDGTKTTGGAGGEGGSGGGSEGADGGTGGGVGNIDANAGGDGEGEGAKGCAGDGLAAGGNGEAIRKASGVNFSFNNNGGTILGGIDEIGML